MRPDEIRKGMSVWYWPSIDRNGRPVKRYAATVDSEPFVIGDSTHVVHLRDVEPAYAIDTQRPGRTRVAAAVLSHIALRGEP